MKSKVVVMCVMVLAACATQASEPLVSSEEPDPASVESELGNACTLQCGNANLQCNATCERFPRPGCEESCDTRLANCLRSCGCPFTEDFTRVVFDHATATNNFLCVGSFPGAGVAYQVFNLFKRTEQVRRTLQCDNTTTETVLSSVVSPDGSCTHRLFPDQPCGQATTSPTGLCTF